MSKDYDELLIRNAIRSRFGTARNIWLTDPVYSAMSVAEFESVLSATDPIEQVFNEQNFDCDDFALVMHALIKVASANRFNHSVAFGEVITEHDITGDIHSLNFMVDEDLELKFFEPQGRVFVVGQHYKPFFFKG